MFSKEHKKQSLTNKILEVSSMLLLVFLIRTFIFGLYQVPTGSMETTMLVGERFLADKLTYWFRKPQRGEIIAMNAPIGFEYSKNSWVRLFQEYVWGPSNWTKRVIAVPGDTISGVIEDGKAVVYLNGQKLDEPYLNQYPLIPILKVDPVYLQKEIDREFGDFLRNKMVDQKIIEHAIWERMAQHATHVSYDPNAPFLDQPFYRIVENHVIRGENGDIELLWPGVGRLGRYKLGVPSDRKRYWDKSDQFYVQLAEDEYWCMGDNREGSQDCRYFGPVKGSSIHARLLMRIWSHDSFESWWIVDLLKHPIDFWIRMRWGRFFQWIY